MYCVLCIPYTIVTLSIHMSMDYVLTIVTCAAMNIRVHVSFQIMVSLDICSWMGLLDNNLVLILVFWRTFILFCIMAVWLYIPTNSMGGFPFLQTLSSIYCLYKKGKATHSSILAWRIPWTYGPWDCKESDTTERPSLTLLEAINVFSSIFLKCNENMSKCKPFKVMHFFIQKIVSPVRSVSLLSFVWIS